MNVEEALTRHSPQDAQADLAVAVKVGIEADSVVSSSDELYPGGVDGVVGGAAEQEEEETPLIRGVERPSNQGVNLGGQRRKCK